MGSKQVQHIISYPDTMATKKRENFRNKKEQALYVQMGHWYGFYGRG